MVPDKLLAELIALPSVNPAFLPARDERGGEWRVTDFLSALGAQAGLPVEYQEVFPGANGAKARRNLIVRWSPPSEPKQRIILAPHFDTVGSVDMPKAHFQPRRIGGKMHGRGACDTKGSVAAMFSALLNVVKKGPSPRKT